MSKDKYSLKSLSKERLIDIIASLDWEINWWKEKEDTSRYFEKQVVEKDKEIKIYKKALELACETIRAIMPDKPLWICGEAIAERLGIPMTSEIKDFDYFIKQATEIEKGE